MKNLQELQATAQRMQDYLEEPASNDEEKIIKRMEMLQVLIAKSGNMLADAKFLQDTATQNACKAVLEDASMYGQSTTFINKYVNAAGKEFNHVVTWFDRINSAASKQHAGLITVLSFRKEQMKMV
jgi:hypothetical protein